MNRTLVALACLLALAAPARAVSDDDGTITIFVGTPESAEGRNFVRATPAHPVYFLPVVLGYRERGDILAYYRRSPPVSDQETARIETLLAAGLAAQGYRVATNASPPTLVITFAWGCSAPFTDSAQKKQRYFVDLTAIDLAAYRQHRRVLLWGDYVLTPYWGHYIDEVLPTLIATGVPLFGSHPRPESVPPIPAVRNQADWDLLGYWQTARRLVSAAP
jgi:hypothetical protein